MEVKVTILWYNKYSIKDKSSTFKMTEKSMEKYAERSLYIYIFYIKLEIKNYIL